MRVDTVAKLHLGCGTHPRAGYINVDSRPLVGVDLVANLERPWPWPNESIDEIYCEHFPEHLRQVWEEPDPEHLARATMILTQPKAASMFEHPVMAACAEILQALKNPKRTYGILHFMEESYRVLKPSGRLECLVPSTGGPGAWQDPTHVSYWNRNSLMYFVSRYPEYQGNASPPKCDWVEISVADVRAAGGLPLLHFILEKL